MRIAEVKELAAQMAEIDRVFENLELLAANNWQAPDDHPDLSAVSEAGRMNDLFRAVSKDQHGDLHRLCYAPLDYLEREWARLEQYSTASQTASDLENAILANEHATAQIKLEALDNRCNECHSIYR